MSTHLMVVDEKSNVFGIMPDITLEHFLAMQQKHPDGAVVIHVDKKQSHVVTLGRLAFIPPVFHDYARAMVALEKFPIDKVLKPLE